MTDMIMRGKYDAKVVTDIGFVPKRDDLISRAWVLAEYDRQHQGPPGGARKIMAEAPAVDAVPVVRCRDCKHGEPTKNARDEAVIKCEEICWLCRLPRLMEPDWYCADGERRDSE